METGAGVLGLLIEIWLVAIPGAGVFFLVEATAVLEGGILADFAGDDTFLGAVFATTGADFDFGLGAATGTGLALGGPDGGF